MRSDESTVFLLCLPATKKPVCVCGGGRGGECVCVCVFVSVCVVSTWGGELRFRV
jgi:hypothetical protein